MNYDLIAARILAWLMNNGRATATQIRFGLSMSHHLNDLWLHNTLYLMMQKNLVVRICGKTNHDTVYYEAVEDYAGDMVLHR